MFDVGFAEILLLSVIGLLVLGPERLPRVARTLGGLVRKARGSWGSLKRTIDAELRAEELKTPLDDLKKASKEFTKPVEDLKEPFEKFQSGLKDATDSVSSTLKGGIPDPLSDPKPAPDTDVASDSDVAPDSDMATGSNAPPAAKTEGTGDG